jgi:glycosyltransferase involved in cell wall biosynthesis
MADAAGMGSTPLVSILIPAYDAGKWIEETIRSALAQTWPRTEIIVVDDGSTDETSAIARRFESSGVQVVSTRHAGAAAARNTALSHSRGAYIQWLDADDLLSPAKIECQMQAAERAASPRVLLSSGWVHFHHRPANARIVPTALWHDLSPTEWLVRKMSGNLHMPNSTWLVSREITRAAGPWDTRLVVDDDGEYFCRVLLASDAVKFVPVAMAYYRLAGFSSVSRIGASRPKLEALLLSMRFHIQYLRSLEDSPRTRSACLAYLNTWYLYFLPDRHGMVPQLEQWAAELGGALEEPTLSWKYEWLRRLWGWPAARRAQLLLPRIRWTGANRWDKLLSRLGARRDLK